MTAFCSSTEFKVLNIVCYPGSSSIILQITVFYVSYELSQKNTALSIAVTFFAVSPTDITYNWHWKTPKNKLISYGLETVNIAVVIDGSNRKYFNIIQRLVYNVVRLFGSESNVAFILFGGTVDMRFATWKNYKGLGPLMTGCSSLS